MGWIPNSLTRSAPAPAPPPLPQVVAPPAGPSAYDLQAAWDAFHPAVPVVQPGPGMLPDLSPDEIHYFDTAVARAKQSYGQGIAQDQYSHATALQNHNLSMQSLNRRYDEIRRRMPGQYVQRGIGQSGIAQRGYKDYAEDRNQAVAAQNLGWQRTSGQHALNQQQIASTWDQTTKDLYAQKAARRNTIQALYKARVG